MSDVFNAFADQKRREILELVASEPRTTASLIKNTKLSATAIEKHLKTLLSANLLAVSTKGKTSTYSLDKAGFAEAAKWFGKFGQAFMTGQADILGENLGSLISTAASWFERKVGSKVNVDFDPETAGRELGKKLSEAKQEATEKLGEATVKVKDVAKKATAKKPQPKPAATKKPATKKPAAKTPVAKKPVAKKPAAKKTTR